MRRAAVVVAVLIASCALAASAVAKVLRVGSFNGIKGQFTSIQAAVERRQARGLDPHRSRRLQDVAHLGAQGRAAVPRRRAHHHAQPAHPRHEPQDGDRGRDQARLGGVQQQGLGAELRPAAARASSSASPYVPYARHAAGGASGVNGLMVWKAANVSIENLTACNFLGGSRAAGNEIWWNGGAESGKVGGHGFTGQYLTTTSTYLKNQSAAGEASAAQYGVFSSNWSGGTWNRDLRLQLQRLGLLHRRLPPGLRPDRQPRLGRVQRAGLLGLQLRRPAAHRELAVRQQRGRVRHQQPERRQPGAPERRLPAPASSPPVKGAHSCWVFIHNNVHDNNNPNVPAAGSAAAGPVGTGMSISGGRNDTVMDNRFANNNAWGVILVPGLDSGKPCFGGTFGGVLGPRSCLWDDYGDALVGNTFSHNGSYGHPSQR